MPLSRLHDELFLKDTRYACDYWEEHKENFNNMLTTLLTEESLLKILNASKETSIMFNEKINAVTKEDNENLIRACYNKLESLIQPTRDFTNQDKQEENEFNGKKFLFDGMVGYFKVLLLAKDEEGKPLREIYLQHKDIIKEFIENLLPSNYTLEQACELFAPQLIVYFSYLIWKYDQAMEGKLVEDYLNDFKKRRENLVNADKVAEIWTNIEKHQESNGDSDNIECDSVPNDGKTNAGQKNEAWIFQESCSRQNDAVEGYWTRKGSEIRNKYNEKSNEDKLSLLQDARNIISDMGNGIYQNALMYCPELNPEKLSGINTSNTPFSIHSLDELVEYVRKLPNIPRLTPKNQQDVIALLKDNSFADKFINVVSKKLSSQISSLPLVAISRQHLLNVFCHLVFVLTLGLPITTVTDNIPGCSPDDQASNSFGNLNVPFSTKEQRDATPIPKAPIPNIAKKNQENNNIKMPNDIPSSIEEVSETKRILCSEPTCKKEQKDKKFQVCSFCKKVQKSIPYCCRDCQIKHWKSEHKYTCYKNKQ